MSGDHADGVAAPKTKRRRYGRWLLGIMLLAVIGGVAAWRTMIVMPSQSFRGKLDRLDANERSLQEELETDVTQLAEVIGERNIDRYPSLVGAAEYVEGRLATAGYNVERQTYTVRDRECWNLVAELRGSKTPDEIVVVGAHYDSYLGTPGANDNASGTAALLALATRYAHRRPDCGSWPLPTKPPLLPPAGDGLLGLCAALPPAPRGPGVRTELGDDRLLLG